MDQIRYELENWKKQKTLLEKLAKKRGWKVSSRKDKKEEGIKA